MANKQSVKDIEDAHAHAVRRIEQYETKNADLVVALREIAARADFRYHDPCERSRRDVQEWEREIRDFARAALARATEGE